MTIQIVDVSDSLVAKANVHMPWNNKDGVFFFKFKRLGPDYTLDSFSENAQSWMSAKEFEGADKGCEDAKRKEEKLQILAADRAQNPEKYAVADLRTIATAIESYIVDEGKAPEAEDFPALKAILSPFYIKVVPDTDPWGTGYSYIRKGDQGYVIDSAGPDRHWYNADDFYIDQGGHVNRGSCL